MRMDRDLTVIAAIISQSIHEERLGTVCGRRIAASNSLTANRLGNGDKKASKPLNREGAFAKPQPSRHGFTSVRSKLCGTYSKTDLSVKELEGRVMYLSAAPKGGAPMVGHCRLGVWFLALMQLAKACALLPALDSAASRSHSDASRSKSFLLVLFMSFR